MLLVCSDTAGTFAMKSQVLRDIVAVTCVQLSVTMIHIHMFQVSMHQLRTCSGSSRGLR